MCSFFQNHLLTFACTGPPFLSVYFFGPHFLFDPQFLEDWPLVAPIQLLYFTLFFYIWKSIKSRTIVFPNIKCSTIISPHSRYVIKISANGRGLNVTSSSFSLKG
jgi:hypothetical protein